MNSNQQTQATGYVARVAISLSALVVLVPLKGIEGGLRVVEGGLDVASGVFGSTANGVSWAANKVAKASQTVETKCKSLCDEVRAWQAAELSGELPAENLNKSPVAADLASADTEGLKAIAAKLAADAEKDSKTNGTSKKVARAKVTAGSGIKVCDICNMPKTVKKYEQHRTMCEARYEDAKGKAKVLVNGGAAVEKAALSAAVAAGIRYDGGRTAVVEKLVKVLQEDAASGAKVTEDAGVADAAQPALKIVQPPSEGGGTPGSVLDPKPVPA